MLNNFMNDLIQVFCVRGDGSGATSAAMITPPFLHIFFYIVGLKLWDELQQVMNLPSFRQ